MTPTRPVHRRTAVAPVRNLLDGIPLRSLCKSGAAISVLALSLAALTACAPDLGPMSKLKPAGDYAVSQSLRAPASDWPSDRWWTVYGDPQLDSLIGEALQGSPDLRAAEARLRRAEAEAEQTGATRFPSVSGDASLQTSKMSLNEGFPEYIKRLLPAGYHTQTRIAASLTYQLDFFGRNRAALAAAISAEKAARADEASARLQISTAVASAYADLQKLQIDRDEAAEAVDLRRQTLSLVGQRLANGLETRGSYSLQEGTVPVAQGDVEVIDRQIAVTRHQIAALLGDGPDRGREITRPGATALHAFGLPPALQLELLGRRPDIVAARLRAEAAAKRVKVARADFYPNINIAADYGLQSLGLNTLLQKDSIIGALGPAISLPVFSGGRIEGAYRGARADYDQAVATYDQALANAFRDVVDAVDGQRVLKAQLDDAQKALVSAQEGLRIANLRYQGGLSPYLNVLTAENGALNARRSLADLQAQGLSLDIELVRALGGGFVEAAAAKS